MKKYGIACLMLLLNLQGCAMQRDWAGIGQTKTYTVTGSGNWKQAFRSAVAREGGSIVESSDEQVSATLKDQRVKVVARVIESGRYEVSGKMQVKDFKSVSGLVDDAHDATQDITAYMGAHGFVVREGK